MVSMLAHPATGQLERPGTDDGVQQTVWMLRDIPFAPKRGSERQERVEEHRKPDLDRQSQQNYRVVRQRLGLRRKEGSDSG